MGAGCRLVVARAQLVECPPEQWAEALEGLRVLYRDFFEGGGLEELRRRAAVVATVVQNERGEVGGG